MDEINPKFNDSGALLCPNCGCGYLDYERIEIFERNNEDDENGLHVTVKWEGHPLLDARPVVAVDGDLSLSPSERRQGMTVLFRCENCEPLLYLDIDQHKGPTFFSWRIVAKPAG